MPKVIGLEMTEQVLLGPDTVCGKLQEANELSLITKYKWHSKQERGSQCHKIKVEVMLTQLQNIIVFFNLSK